MCLSNNICCLWIPISHTKARPREKRLNFTLHNAHSSSWAFWGCCSKALWAVHNYLMCCLIQLRANLNLCTKNLPRMMSNLTWRPETFCITAFKSHLPASTPNSTKLMHANEEWHKVRINSRHIRSLIAQHAWTSLPSVLLCNVEASMHTVLYSDV